MVSFHAQLLLYTALELGYKLKKVSLQELGQHHPRIDPKLWQLHSIIHTLFTDLSVLGRNPVTFLFPCHLLWHQNCQQSKILTSLPTIQPMPVFPHQPCDSHTSVSFVSCGEVSFWLRLLGDLTRRLWDLVLWHWNGRGTIWGRETVLISLLSTWPKHRYIWEQGTSNEECLHPSHRP